MILSCWGNSFYDLHNVCPCSSVGRASDWRSEGPWFNPERGHNIVYVALWKIEHSSNKNSVGFLNYSWRIAFLLSWSALPRCNHLQMFPISQSRGITLLRAVGLVVWFSLRVREVAGSIPARPLCLFFHWFCADILKKKYDGSTLAYRLHGCLAQR